MDQLIIIVHNVILILMFFIIQLINHAKNVQLIVQDAHLLNTVLFVLLINFLWIINV